MRRLRRIVFVAAGLLAFVGCAKPLSPEEKLAAFTKEGWRLFSAGEYASAEEQFRQATEIDFTDAGAQLGLGWSLLRQESLTAGANALLRVGARDTLAYAHAQAGLAVLYDAQGQFDRSISAAEAVLVRDSLYVFPYDQRVDWRDLCYLLAKNYLVLSPQTDPDLSRALRYLRRIDPSPALVAADSTTWTADGRLYSTLAEAVLKRLETVQRTVSGTAS